MDPSDPRPSDAHGDLVELIDSLIDAVRDMRDTAEGISSRLRTSRYVQLALAVTMVLVVVLGLAAWRSVERDSAATARAEVRSCRDAIEGRADLRDAVAGVVEIVIGVTDNPAALQPLLENVRTYLATQYPEPGCAARLGLDTPTTTVSTTTVPPAAPATPTPAPTPTTTEVP